MTAKDIPEIEFRVTGFTPSETAQANITALVAHGLQVIEVPAGDVLKIIIADDGSYGAAIQQFAPNAGYTSDSVYRGVGKCIPSFENGSYRGSNLVLHTSVITALMIDPATRPSGEVEAFRYSFFHEFGHCLDNRLRKHTPPQACAPIDSYAQRCARDGSATLLDEYAACFFSAHCLTPDGFNYLATSTHQNLQTYRDDLERKRTLYRLRLGELVVVRDAALDLFWRGLIEFGKLYAFRHANAALPAPPSWPARNGQAHQLLADFEAALATAWATYPNCQAEFTRVTTETWFNLTRMEGYHFEVKAEGDYLWLS